MLRSREGCFFLEEDGLKKTQDARNQGAERKLLKKDKLLALKLDEC